MTPLIPARLRVPALVAGLFAWIGTIVLGVVFAGDRRAGQFDRMIIHDVHSAVGQRGTLANVLVSTTDVLVLVAVILVVLVAALARRRWEVALLVVLGPVLAMGFAELVFKPLFNRRMLGYLSYPSGHTVAAVTTYSIALLLIISGRSALTKLIAVPVWFAVCLIAMTGLVAMNYHYPTDTIGGFCLAMGVVLPCAVLADAWGRRLRPVSAHPIPAPRLGGAQPAMPPVVIPPDHPEPQADPAGQASAP